MKFIKYLAIVLFAGALMTSCGEVVNVGQTTVQFSQEQVESGFGAGTVYVPLTITADNWSAVNLSDVNVKIKVDATYTNGNVYVGKEDEDFRITAYDMVFRNNYEEPETEEEKAEPFAKKIKGVEIMILKTDIDVMEFKLAIESSNTTIGTQTECVVRLEKSATDRLCGTYRVEPTVASPFDGEVAAAFDVQITWNGEYDCFEIAPFDGWTYSPIYAYWDEESESMYMLPYEPLMWYDSASMLMCYQMFFVVEGGTAVPVSSEVILDVDMDKGTIAFPEDQYFGVLVFSCDAGYNPTSLYGRFTSACAGYVMTKK